MAAAQAPEVARRPDGLGRFDFGEPANDLASELESVLGQPADDTSYTPDGAGPFEFLPVGYRAAYELRIVTWDEPDFQSIERRSVQRRSPGPSHTRDPPARVLGDDELRSAFSDGIAVGSRAVDLRAQHPDTVFGTFDVCEIS